MPTALAPAADIWSLGVIAVEALTQHAPDWRKAASQPIFRESLPAPFQKIATECLQLDPARRGTIQEIKNDLGVTIAEPKSSTITPLKSSAEPEPQKTPPWLTSKTIVVLVAIALAVVAIVFYAQRPSPRPPAQLPATSPTTQAPTMPVTPPPRKGIEKGSVVDRFVPDVAGSARRTIQGKIKVTVRVKVNADGKVSSAKLDSPGPSKYFANLAVRAAEKWKFNPAQNDGQTVPSEWVLRFHFGRSGTDVSPTEVSP